MIARCLKILVLVSLAALALRASSLLAGYYVAPPCSSSESSGHQLQSTNSGGGGGVSASSYRRNRRRMEGALAAFDARRFRQQHDGAGGLETDKRLAPTGSNPLHNLR